MKHSTVMGGSTAERTIQCPGHVRLAQGLPKPEPSPAALEGTMLHAAAALYLLGDVKSVDDLIGFEAEGHVLTEELAETLLKPALEAAEYAIGEDEYVVEQRVTFGDEIPGAWGTVDILSGDSPWSNPRADPLRTLITDFKFGHGFVDAHENDQCMFYAAAAFRTPELEDLMHPNVSFLIIQPKQRDTWFHTTRDEIERWVLKAKAAVREAAKETAPFREGPWCAFCPALPACPLKLDGVKRLAQLTHIDEHALPDLLDDAERAKPWIKAIQGLAHQQLEHGHKVEGWKLVENPGKRKWKNEKDACDFLYENLTGSFLDERLITPAEAERRLKALGKDPDVSDLVTRSAGTTLVREEDSRPALFTGVEALRKLAN